jgi:hypothetical protein
VPTTEETNKPSATKKVRARKEIPYKQAVIMLIIGDLLCFLIFAALGRSSHGEASGFAAIPQIVITALHFVVKS